MITTRIVNGKLLRGECFDQLVDPRRSIPEAGVPIHGIRPEMVRGQPSIAEVLPDYPGLHTLTIAAFDPAVEEAFTHALGSRG